MPAWRLTDLHARAAGQCERSVVQRCLSEHAVESARVAGRAERRDDFGQGRCAARHGDPEAGRAHRADRRAQSPARARLFQNPSPSRSSAAPPSCSRAQISPKWTYLQPLSAAKCPFYVAIRWWRCTGHGLSERLRGAAALDRRAPEPPPAKRRSSAVWRRWRGCGCPSARLATIRAPPPVESASFWRNKRANFGKCPSYRCRRPSPWRKIPARVKSRSPMPNRTTPN